MSLRFLVSLAIITVTLGACSENRSKNKGENLVVREGFNNGSCFDVKKLEQMLRGPLARYHILSITTDFHVVRSSSSRVDSLMAYKAFGVVSSIGSELGLIPPVNQQSECDQVLFRSTSGEPILFKVTKSSIDQLTLVIEKDSQSPLPEFRRDALYLSPQPIAYDFTLLEQNRLKVITTYKTTNPICNNDQTFTYKVTKVIEWQSSPQRFAPSVEVDREYLTKYRSTVQTPFEMDPNDAIPIAKIRNLSALPAKSELQYCL